MDESAPALPTLDRRLTGARENYRSAGLAKRRRVDQPPAQLISRPMNAKAPSPREPVILVSGDLTNDHFLYTGERFNALDLQGRGVVRQTKPGGVALLYRLLGETFGDASAPDNRARRVHSRIDFQTEVEGDTCWEGYALWEPCAGFGKDGKANGKDLRWRSIRGLGFGEQSVCEPPPLRLNKKLPGELDVVVLDDLGLEFRHKPAAALWCLDLLSQSARKPWIVLKMAAPAAHGDLWWNLVQHHADRLVVVTSAEDLRAAPARISRGSSWERTVEDLSRELASHPVLRELARCRHLIVRFGKEGAFWRARTESGAGFQEHLVFDPQRIEGEWMQELKQKKIDGRVFGMKTVLTAAVVWELARHSVSGGEVNLAPALQAGLDAIRTLQREGHGKVGYLEPSPNAPTGKKFLHEPGFPCAAVAERIRAGGKDFATLPLQAQKGEQWSLLGPNDQLAALRRRAHAIAVLVARRGPGVLENIPYGRFGKLQSVDRHEIEQYRAVRQLMHEYVAARRRAGADDEAKPLAIGVFGAPGAGKSFGVKQIARLVLGDQKPLEFNLSQFKDQQDLLGAFHQVRDRALQGGVPLVFWDEFDSRDFFWLQYFLAPIQDGKFQEGQITHYIGPSIFVFAGGTSESWSAFGVPPAEIDPADRGQWEQNFRMSKGRDFKSRISAALNVLGPNVRKAPVGTEGQPPKNLSDVCVPIRRALLLRSMLGLGEDERWDGDPGLLSALLEVPSFRHGARSLEKLVLHLKERGGRNPKRAHLPGLEILSMHLESPEEFLRLCDRALPFQQEARVIGPHIHGYWWDLGQKNNWTQKYPREFDQLPEDVKEDNYAAARRIPELLALAGLALASGDAAAPLSTEKVKSFLRENLELLAETEHDGWMAQKLAGGWRLGSATDGKQDVANRLHPALVPYAELSDEDQEKDRQNVLRIPDFVSAAGFKITPVGEENQEA
jgi:hypothetical protein